MKIIDLLNKIANGEPVEKFKYNGVTYCYTGFEKDLYKSEINEYDFDIDINSFCLNSQVEIIEDKSEPKPITKKDLEALGYAFGEMRKALQNGWNKSLNNEPFKEDKKIEKLKHAKEEDILVNGKSLLDKIDEIIDCLNKGDK